MSSVSVAHSNVAHKAYIATEAFDSYFFSYTAHVDSKGVRTGTLDIITNDSSLCPKGRILRENGRKLYAGANPGVNYYLVGVYDSKTLLSGFIDPNGKVFQVFNENRPYDMDDCASEHGSICSERDQDYGPPIYTRGNIETSDGNVLAGANNDAEVGIHCDISGASYAVCAIDGNGEYPYIETGTYGGNQAYAGMYGVDGSIWNTGLIHPFNTIFTTDALTSNSPTNASATITTQYAADSGVVILLTRATSNSGTVMGNLWYNVGGSGNSTITVYSSSGHDNNSINVMLFSRNG
jgi:hypothetical protein